MVQAPRPLGDFLRARREQAQRAAFGIPDSGRRRGPGLSREEVAFLAGVSSHYYTRLEQGTDRSPSASVLRSLARAFRLNDEETKHLFTLAEPAADIRTEWDDRVPGPVRSLLGQWTLEPAVIINRYRDVLAANDLAQRLNPGFAPGTNLIGHTFLDPDARRIYPDWPAVAQDAVAALRAAADTHGDHRLNELLERLTGRSPEFRNMWSHHDVHARSTGTKQFSHPKVGTVKLDFQTFNVNGTDDHVLYVFLPGTEHATGQLRRLAADPE